jgi:hypothetical protein
LFFFKIRRSNRGQHFFFKSYETRVSLKEEKTTPQNTLFSSITSALQQCSRICERRRTLLFWKNVCFSSSAPMSVLKE